MYFKKSVQNSWVIFSLRPTYGEIIGTILIFSILFLFGGGMTTFFIIKGFLGNAIFVAVLTLIVGGVIWLAITNFPTLYYDPSTNEVRLNGQRLSVNPDDKIILRREIKVRKIKTDDYKRYRHENPIRVESNSRYRTKWGWRNKYSRATIISWEFYYDRATGEEIFIGDSQTTTPSEFNLFAEEIAKELDINFIDQTGEDELNIAASELDKPLSERLAEDNYQSQFSQEDFESIGFSEQREGNSILLKSIRNPLTISDFFWFLLNLLLISVGLALLYLSYFLIVTFNFNIWAVASSFILIIPGIAIVYVGSNIINNLKLIYTIKISAQQFEVTLDYLVTNKSVIIPMNELEKIVRVNLKTNGWSIEFISDKVRFPMKLSFSGETAQILIDKINTSILSIR